MNRFAHVVLGCLLLTATGFAGEPSLRGRWGDSRAPKQLLSPSKNNKTNALVVFSASSVCPLSKRLVPVLNELQKEFQKAGIQFIALLPNGMETVASIAEFALDTNLAFPVYKDDRNQPWHEQLKLTTTPQVVVLDTRQGYDVAKVVYRGQADDQWFGGGTANGKKPYLKMALQSFVKGQAPEHTETAASGCAIAKNVRRDLSAYEHVTYYKDVMPIIQNKCQACHREGEPGGELFMSFNDYDTVASMIDTIIDRVENKIMPPWHAKVGDKKKQGGLKHDASLTEEQISILLAWHQNGTKAGDKKDAPAEIQWPAAGDWKIGKPDFIFQMPEPYIVPAKRLDEYQYYRAKANFPEDRYIQAVETRPGNKAVVHHVGVILGPATDEKFNGSEAMLKLYGLTGDKIRKVGDYVPGDPFNARTYPEGYGLILPKNTDIVFEMHYTPTGTKQEADISQMGIVWAKEKPQHVIETKVFNRKDIRLMPHDSHYEMSNWYAFETDVKIYALAPHMHFRGKDYLLYKVTKPNTKEEKREIVLKIANYDFNWQRTYEFEKPIELRAGDALFAVMHFDNSHFNPNNPDPEQKIGFGIKSDQEMFNTRVKFERVTLE